MSKYRCVSGCCILNINPYTYSKTFNPLRRRNKAGVFIYDPKEDKTLLVQSRGHLWGPPKGTMEQGEAELACAVREVKEETGLNVNHADFSDSITIHCKSTYYYLEMSCCDVEVQSHIVDNDANGIGWIKTSCLEKGVQNGDILLSKHCIHVFKKFRNKTFGCLDVSNTYAEDIDQKRKV